MTSSSQFSQHSLGFSVERLTSQESPSPRQSRIVSHPIHWPPLPSFHLWLGSNKSPLSPSNKSPLSLFTSSPLLNPLLPLPPRAYHPFSFTSQSIHHFTHFAINFYIGDSQTYIYSTPPSYWKGRHSLGSCPVMETFARILRTLSYFIFRVTF